MTTQANTSRTMISQDTLSILVRGFVISPGIATYHGEAVGYAIYDGDFVGQRIRDHQIIAAVIDESLTDFLVNDEFVKGHMVRLVVLPKGPRSEKLGWKGVDEIGHWDFHTLGAEPMEPRDF